MIDESVWFGGNKEFYDDIQCIAKNAYPKLYLMYAEGKDKVKEYQGYQDRIIPVHKKIVELGEELMYADSISFLEKITASTLTNESEQLKASTDSIKRIENLFNEQIVFFFYLNLNRTESFSNKYYFPVRLGQFPYEINEDTIRYAVEIFHLGTPKHCLMAILVKDKNIRQWFSQRIIDIINYRRQISKTIPKIVKIHLWHNASVCKD